MKDTYNKNKRQRKLGTGSSAKDKPSKWALTDILSFLDVFSYEREYVVLLVINLIIYCQLIWLGH